MTKIVFDRVVRKVLSSWGERGRNAEKFEVENEKKEKIGFGF